MDFKHIRRTNTAYIKTIDLQLNGNQINLTERPNSRDQARALKKLARSLRPCILKRPMSATPSFGYRGLNRNKKMPPWSRPQSAEGSSGLRRNKLAAKFSDCTLHDPDYCAEFGATYTLSSSQLLNSLMGSCSINEGLDSDCTPVPSPQPSLGDTIRAAAQLEPGLTSKPPLPPSTPTPLTSDDIIALKFQRWFPDAILESEIIQRSNLNPTEQKKDESEHSDGGISGVDVFDEDGNEKPVQGNNISTFVRKRKTPKNKEEEHKKLVVKFDDRKIDINDEESQVEKSPKVIIHEPDLYGCDIVTEEFATESNARCLTPDYISTLRHSRLGRSKSENRLSLTDLNEVKPSFNCEVRSNSLKMYPYIETHKENDQCVGSTNYDKSFKGSDADLLGSENYRTKSYASNIGSRNEIVSPLNFETSASNYRFTSTPVGNESSKNSSNENLQEQLGNKKNNSEVDNNKCPTTEEDFKLIESSYDQKSYLALPSKLNAIDNEIYHDHLSSYKSFIVDDLSKHCEQKSNEINNESLRENKNHSNITSQEGFVLCNDVEKSFNYLTEINSGTQHSCSITEEPLEKQTIKTELNQEKLGSYEKHSNSSLRSFESEEKGLSTIKESKKDYYISKTNSKHKSYENLNKNSVYKNNKLTKEICRAASVPPYPSSKLPSPVLKKPQIKIGPPHSQNTKRKVRRSMSYDSSATPDIPEKDSGVSSFEDIVTMIKVLEKEDLQTPVLEYKTSSSMGNAGPEQSSSATEILNFLDEVERGTMAVVGGERMNPLSVSTNENVGGHAEAPVSSRLGSLLNTDTAELAQQVMNLTLQLEEKSAVCKAVEERYKQSVDLLKQQKEENDEANKRQQKFIDQLLKEKRQLAVQYETAIKELETKHEAAIKVIDERHKIEMKKAQEKFNAAEKIRRDKWIDAKTKKIKELTVRGLEPELERMAVAHQEELAELRRVHQRQLVEAEAAWGRRAAALREQEASEHQAAVMHEREAARHRLEQEMNQIEKSYQEQRRRLLEEVRQEKELLQRQSERIIAEKQAEISRQVDEAKRKLQEKMSSYDKRHQEEIAKLKECLETEKQAWITRQKAAWEEKEVELREELKRERDRHIELVIRRLESEAAAKEQAIENKIKRLKESYDGEVNDLDSTLKDLRARLKETRAELQRSEDNNGALKAQLSQAVSELSPLKMTVEKLRKENYEALQQHELKLAEVHRELTEAKQTLKEQINKVLNEKEKQLQQVYTRVKEAISKKEEALLLVTKQRDTALEQCSRLEKLLETQRNHSLKL